MLNAIKERKSVRHFSTEKIPMEDLYDILDAGRVAPSAGNTQDRLFIVVTKDDIKEGLAKACDQEFVKTASTLVVVIADQELMEERYGERGKNFLVYLDSAASIENMLIQATDMGIGSCWVSGFHEPEVRAVLNIPDRYKPIAIVALGYERESFERPVEKFSVPALTFMEKFGNHKEPRNYEGLLIKVKKLKEAAADLDKRIKEKGFLNVFKEEFGQPLPELTAEDA